MKTLCAFALVCLSVAAFGMDRDVRGLPRDYAIETGMPYDVAPGIEENTGTIGDPIAPARDDDSLVPAADAVNESAFQQNAVAEGATGDDWL